MEKPTASDQKPTESADTEPTVPKNHKRDKSTYYDSYGNHDGENKYTVEERTIGDTGTQVDNCFVKNKTGLSLDFDGLLSAKLPFSIDKGINSPQVLIYHTHTSEAYLDEDVDFSMTALFTHKQQRFQCCGSRRCTHRTAQQAWNKNGS